MSSNLALDSLCSSCRNIIHNSKLILGSRLVTRKDHEYFIHQSLQSIRESSRQLCSFCELFLKSLSEVKIDLRHLKKHSAKRVWIDVARNKHDGLLQIEVGLMDYDKNHLSLNICGNSEPGSPLKFVDVNHVRPILGSSFKVDLSKLPGKVPESPFDLAFDECDSEHIGKIACGTTCTSSSQHMQLARQWLGQCNEKHPSCLSGRDMTFMPNRVLEIINDENKFLSAKLHVKAPAAEYCTLSHCWGGISDIPTLTAAKLAKFEQNIDFWDLPNSFRDALVITRALGHKYLWIDSLCIIQDSQDDWARESAVMGKIFQQSSCTIAAAAASNPHDGIFINKFAGKWLARRGILKERFVFNGSVHDGLKAMTGKYSNFDCGVVPKGSWETRGWKSVDFGQRGLKWECGRNHECASKLLGSVIEFPQLPTTKKKPGCGSRQSAYKENGETNGNSNFSILKVGSFVYESTSNLWPLHFSPSGGLREGIVSGSIVTKLGFSQFLKEPLNVSSLQSIIFFHREWMRLIYQYSSQDLTIQSDKLPALSGIAQAIIDSFDTTYIAGMWKQSIHFDLLWTPENILDNPRVDIIPETPSWSWALSTAPVQPYLPHILRYDPERDPPYTYNLWSKLLNVQLSTHPSDLSRTGRVWNGTLTLSGPLRKLNANQTTYNNFWNPNHRICRILSTASANDTNNQNIIGEIQIDRPQFDIENIWLLPLIEEKTLAQKPNGKSTLPEKDIRLDKENSISNGLTPSTNPIEVLYSPRPIVHFDPLNSSHEIVGISLEKLDDGRFKRTGVFVLWKELEMFAGGEEAVVGIV